MAKEVAARLADAEQRAQIASAAYVRQQTAARDAETLYMAATERAIVAEQALAALKRAVRAYLQVPYGHENIVLEERLRVLCEEDVSAVSGHKIDDSA